MQHGRLFHKWLFTPCSALMLLGLLLLTRGGQALPAYAASAPSAEQAFAQAAHEFAVPVSLLKAICYLEGHLSTHQGAPSVDHGYGCMHLVKNGHADTLDSAAQKLGVSVRQLQLDLATNIRGGAAILRQDALRLSQAQQTPPALADWAGAVALYSNATTPSVARLYVDAVYKLLNTGFSGQTDSGETVTLAPQAVTPNLSTIPHTATTTTIPAGCSNDGKTDYPGAIDCILPPATFDCNTVPNNAPCNYDSANRPTDFAITDVVIHDTEGSAQSALDVFQDPTFAASTHYLVDTDGTVYQILHEQDIAFQAGNFWYNEHSVGIEHVGFDATGFQWYNATEYLASAKLTAYLLKRYNIPLDHDHIVSHGTIPSPTLATSPNHVDPGPYWLWTYYENLIHQQGIAFPKQKSLAHTVTILPQTGKRPFGKNGTETPANFNFFYLYQGPSTASGLIPQLGDGTDITDVTDNVEANITYYYTRKVKDPAGTGDTLYEIWYGEQDQAITPAFFAHAQQVWLAVPAGAAVEGRGIGHVVRLISSGGSPVAIYGRPTTASQYNTGDAPGGAIFVSAYTVIEDGTSNLWYEINYNHRQAWVPASEVAVIA
ncbi:MAG TPA: N-acetylmuramoyl-L-alanine amidase [Ktedonobacterales bacterium]|nr:N-acetylmuramoyl-L-alanine amidase [Ktedonobacterales bacterium]